ncbi:MAG: hypothetical protein LRZ85_06240 [Alphaproteobacteria bacterium]|nr:hypothetical protein [Alphaproteobacteria bacterium]
MIDYTHPHAEKIHQETLSILQHAPSAARLLEQAPLPPGALRIFKTLYPRIFVPDEQSLYIGLPATQDYTDIEQVIDLAAALLELKAKREGMKRPDQALDQEESLQKQHLINLDLILHTFAIVQELEDAGYKAVDCIRKQGLAPLPRVVAAS